MLHEIHLCGPLYLALSYVILPLHRHTKPFTTDRAISGPFQGFFYSRGPPSGRRFGGGLHRLG